MIDPEIQEEYKTFLRHLMSLCRKYEYELLPEMQEKGYDGSSGGSRTDS